MSTIQFTASGYVFAAWPSIAAVERELYPTLAEIHREYARATPPAPAPRVDDPGDDGDSPEPAAA